MHELGYTREMVDVALRAARDAGAREVRGVYLTIGELRDIVDDLMRGCFEHFTKGTPAQDAQLEVARVPFTVRCRTCGHAHPADIHRDESFICPECGRRDYEVATGLEFSIDRVEVA